MYRYGCFRSFHLCQTPLDRECPLGCMLPTGDYVKAISASGVFLAVSCSRHSPRSCVGAHDPPSPYSASMQAYWSRTPLSSTTLLRSCAIDSGYPAIAGKPQKHSLRASPPGRTFCTRLGPMAHLKSAYTGKRRSFFHATRVKCSLVGGLGLGHRTPPRLHNPLAATTVTSISFHPMPGS